MFVACKNDNIDQKTTDPSVYAFEEEDTELGEEDVQLSPDQEDAQVSTADLKQNKEDNPIVTTIKKANININKHSKSTDDKFASAKKGNATKEANVVAVKNNDIKADEPSVNQAAIEKQPADTKQDKTESNDNQATVENQNVDNKEENNEPSSTENEQGEIIKTAYSKVAVEKSGEWGNSTKG